ncbi:hypothetical protein D9M71_841980 [compost metagenome]
MAIGGNEDRLAVGLDGTVGAERIGKALQVGIRHLNRAAAAEIGNGPAVDGKRTEHRPVDDEARA